jgi:hypothetical protein
MKLGLFIGVEEALSKVVLVTDASVLIVNADEHIKQTHSGLWLIC